MSDKHTPRGNGGEAGAPRTRSGGGAGARSAEVRASSRDSAGGAGESFGAHAEARAPQWSGAAAGRGEGPSAWVSRLRLAAIWRGATAGAGPGRGAGSVRAVLANVSCAQGSARETAPGTPTLPGSKLRAFEKPAYCAQSPPDAHPALPDGCRPATAPNVSTCQNTWPSSPAGGKANLDLNQEGGIVPLQIEK